MTVREQLGWRAALRRRAAFIVHEGWAEAW
jgi:hypothetical protein